MIIYFKFSIQVFALNFSKLQEFMSNVRKCVEEGERGAKVAS
jgi:hypothetical protein